MAYKVVRSKQCLSDLTLIFDHLFESYIGLGDTPGEALERASKRVRSIEDLMASLAGAPFQGTLQPDLMPGLRHVTKKRVVFYFTVDEYAKEIRVLAVFFGGQDHRRHMLVRLMTG